MKIKPMPFAAYLVSSMGILLHVYLTLFHTVKGSIYYLIVPAMNVIPYLACMILIRISARPIILLCAGLVLISLDLYQFSEYFFSTRTYRFLVIESYIIILKTAVILPAGCLIGLLLDGLIKRYAARRTE